METLASGIAAPANAENTAQADVPAADANGTEATGDGSAPSLPEAQTPEPPKKDAVQERIDKLTREKYDALRERDRRDYELELKNARIAELEKAQQPEVAPQNDFPTLESVGFDEAKFMAAVATYTKGMTEAAKAAAREEAQGIMKAERDALASQEATKNWVTKEAEFKKVKADYDEKVRRDPREGGPVINESMAQLIMRSDVGPQIAYHLAENVEKSAAIARMPPIDQAREIGRIEGSLAANKLAKPAVSQAPPPPAKVDATDAPNNFKVDTADSDQLSDAEWTRRRNAQELARRKRANS
jgi:hypothetical protein